MEFGLFEFIYGFFHLSFRERSRRALPIGHRDGVTARVREDADQLKAKVIPHPSPLPEGEGTERPRYEQGQTPGYFIPCWNGR
jgi:hypothetical protein